MRFREQSVLKVAPNGEAFKAVCEIVSLSQGGMGSMNPLPWIIVPAGTGTLSGLMGSPGGMGGLGKMPAVIDWAISVTYVAFARSSSRCLTMPAALALV